MASSYDELRSKVQQKLEQRNAIRDELHKMPELVAASLAAHTGAPRSDVLVGHFDADKIFVPGRFEEYPQRIVFAIMFDFKLGEDEDFRIPAAVEVAVHGAGYQVRLDGEDVCALGRPVGPADDANLAVLCGALAPKLFSNVEEYLLT